MKDAELLSLLSNGRYSTELLEKVKEMAEGIVVEDAPVFKTRDEIMKKQQVSLWKHTHTYTSVDNSKIFIVYFSLLSQGRWPAHLFSLCQQKSDGTQLSYRL